jgi:hypothetical protein
MTRKIRIAKVYCLVLLMVVLATACTYRKFGATIPARKLVNVLVDVHLADGIAVNSMATNNFGQRLDSASLYQSVFDKYGVTRAMFDSTMSYYTENPDDFQKIYNKVTAKLKLIEDELNAKQNAEEKKKTEVVDTILKKK